MIVISITELKKFLSNSSNIRNNNIIPILSYIKLECKGKIATLIKTNLHSFIISQIDAEFKKDITILIDEQILASAVNFSKGKDLKISVVGKDIVMNDGFGDTKCQVQDVVNFPAVDTNTGKGAIEFTEDVISALGLAKNHILTSSDKEMRNWMSFVHIRTINNKSHVVGANGSVSYFKSFGEALPEISLDPDTVSIISKYPFVHYSSNDRYDYFQCLGVTYGFIKTETACPKFEPIIDRFKSENSFIINSRDIVLFCEKAISMNRSSVPPEVSIENGDNGSLLLNFVGISDNESASEKIKSDKKTYNVEKILFQPKNMITAVKDLGVEKIKISKIFGNMILSSDEEKDYTGSVMELAKMN